MKKIVKLTESDLVRIVQRVVQEGKTDKGVKEKDSDVKIERFQDTIKNFIKSHDCKVKQVGDDFEIHSDGEHVGQVMFRKDGITVKKQGSKFGKEFDFNELGKVKSEIKKLTESDLTRIVKRVIKENSAKDDLIQMIKNDGWDNTSEIVGGNENLTKLIGVNTPMDFLNLYNDLNSLDDKYRPTWTMFYHDIDNPIMMLISDTDDGNKAYISSSLMFEISDLFSNNNLDEIRKYIKEWLNNVYGFDVSEKQIISRRGYPFNQFRSEEITG